MSHDAVDIKKTVLNIINHNLINLLVYKMKLLK